MNIFLQIILEGGTALVPAVNATVYHKQTQTNLEMKVDGTGRATIITTLKSDIELLQAKCCPLKQVTALVQGAKYFGRLHARALLALSKFGISANDIAWQAGSGMMEYKLKGGYGRDVPYLCWLIVAMVFRGQKKVDKLDRDFSVYTLKQITGLSKDHELGVAGADEMLRWLEVRELTI